MSSVEPAVILLHERDTILIVRRPISAGESVEIDGQTIMIEKSVEVGHKLARSQMAVGDKVVRFGAPIGSMTQAVETGAHVHTHNMKSDYIATHDRGAVDLDGATR